MKKAKTKKGLPQKASDKKGPAKKTAVKKAAPKKATAKTTTPKKTVAKKPEPMKKKPIKAKVAQKPIAKKQAKKEPAAPVHEGEHLQQSFMASLDNLTEFWQVTCNSLKKQQTKSKKAADADNISQALDEATSQWDKYIALKKMIAEFEQNWHQPKKSIQMDEQKIEKIEQDLIIEDLNDDIEEKEVDDLTSDLDYESESELEFADDSAAFFPEDDFYDEESEDYSN